MQLSRRAPSVLGAALAVCLGAASARAQGRADSRGDSSPAAPIHAGNASAAAAISPSGAVLGPDAIRRLKSGDAAQIKLGLDDVRVAGRAGASAVPAIAQLLREGLSPTLVQAALETLGDTESEAATEIVAWYARHRNLALRRTAVDALAKTGGPGAARALRAALSDLDPGVRGTAATALGGMKAHEAIGDLFAALDRNVPEAAVSIGMLCADAECDRLAEKLGHLPFDVVTTGLDEVLLRPPSEVTDDLKVKIVGRLRELGTAEVHHFLKRVAARWPARGSKRVRVSIDQGVLATASSPGSDGSEVAP